MNRSLSFNWSHTPSLLTASLLTILFVTVSCDPTVDILEPSDQYQFSLFGVLNVAADTQMVRVEPIGDSTQIGAPENINANVFLQNEESGQQVSMRDSFVTVGGSSKRVHNFWTTHRLRSGTSYKIAVIRNGEPVTTATTVTPARPPRLVYDSTFYLPCTTERNQVEQRAENTFVVEAHDVEHIAAANVIYPVTYNFGEGPVHVRETFSHYDDVQDKNAYFRIPIFYRRPLIEINPESRLGVDENCIAREDFTNDYALVAVSAAGPNWPDWRGVSINEIARPNSYSNVEGGHGFVAGIYSDTIQVPILDRPEE